METTRIQALLLCKIARWVDPYAYCSFDEDEYIKSFMSSTIEENISDLIAWISEGYTTEELLKDKELIRLFNELNTSAIDELYSKLKNDLTIEEMFKCLGVDNVFKESGEFTKEAYKVYYDVANKFFEGDVDELDKLCEEENCFGKVNV